MFISFTATFTDKPRTVFDQASGSLVTSKINRYIIRKLKCIIIDTLQEKNENIISQVILIFIFLN